VPDKSKYKWCNNCHLSTFPGKLELSDGANKSSIEKKNVLSRRKHMPKTRQASQRRKLVSHMARKFLQMWLRLPLILKVNGQQAQLTLTQKKKGKNQERERKDFNG